MNLVKKNKNFSVNFIPDMYVDVNKITWKISGSPAGVGKTITKSMGKPGIYTIEVYYDGKKISSAQFKVTIN